MPYVCEDLEKYRGRTVGSGQCVALVQKAAGVPHTSTWTAGERVKGAGIIRAGTAIATFFDGVYPNKSSGNHAALYISHDGNGIRVLDQWTSHAASERTIRYKPGDEDPSNDGDRYFVID